MSNNPIISIFHPPTNSVIGSGFFLTPNTIMTNYHVIAGCRKLQVIIYYPNKKVIIDVKKLIFKKSLDFALLQIEEDLGFAALTLGSSQFVEVGSCYKLLCAHWIPPEVKLSPLLNHGMYEEELYNKSLLMEADHKVGPGTSGSPIVDSENRIVSI